MEASHAFQGCAEPDSLAPQFPNQVLLSRTWANAYVGRIDDQEVSNLLDRGAATVAR